MKKLFLYHVRGIVNFNVATAMGTTLSVDNANGQKFQYNIIARNPAKAVLLVEKNFKTGKVTVAECFEIEEINLIEEGSYNMFGGTKE